MTMPAPRQVGQGWRTEKNPFERTTWPAPLQVWHVFFFEPLSGAGAVARVARHMPAIFDAFLDALGGVLERDANVGAKVLAGIVLFSAAVAAAAEHAFESAAAAEHLAEEVGRIVEPAETARAAARASGTRAGAALEGGRAELIVSLAFLIVGKHLVGVGDFLNFSSAALSPGFLSGWYFMACLR